MASLHSIKAGGDSACWKRRWEVIAMRPLNVRQAAVAGLAGSMLLAVLIASRSTDAVASFALACVALLVFWAIGVGTVLAVNRRRMRSVH
jgi:hypothetical protein